VIENFVNAVYLYDDRLRIVYNYSKDGAETVNLSFIDAIENCADSPGDEFGFDASVSTKISA